MRTVLLTVAAVLAVAGMVCLLRAAGRTANLRRLAAAAAAVVLANALALSTAHVAAAAGRTCTPLVGGAGLTCVTTVQQPDSTLPRLGSTDSGTSAQNAVRSALAKLGNGHAKADRMQPRAAETQANSGGVVVKGGGRSGMDWKDAVAAALAGAAGGALLPHNPPGSGKNSQGGSWSQSHTGTATAAGAAPANKTRPVAIPPAIHTHHGSTAGSAAAGSAAASASGTAASHHHAKAAAHVQATARTTLGGTSTLSIKRGKISKPVSGKKKTVTDVYSTEASSTAVYPSVTSSTDPRLNCDPLSDEASSVSSTEVAVDAQTLFAALESPAESGTLDALKAQLAGRSPVISPQVLTEYLSLHGPADNQVRGDLKLLRQFLQDTNGRIGSPADSSGFNRIKCLVHKNRLSWKELRNAGRAPRVGPAEKIADGDTLVLDSAIKDGLEIITRDQKFLNILRQLGWPAEPFNP
jgi:hypothetical protein